MLRWQLTLTHTESISQEENAWMIESDTDERRKRDFWVERRDEVNNGSIRLWVEESNRGYNRRKSPLPWHFHTSPDEWGKKRNDGWGREWVLKWERKKRPTVQRHARTRELVVSLSPNYDFWSWWMSTTIHLHHPPLKKTSLSLSLLRVRANDAGGDEKVAGESSLFLSTSELRIQNPELTELLLLTSRSLSPSEMNDSRNESNR